MPCIDANDGEFNPTKLMPKPACHRARLKADTLRQWRMFTKQLGQIAGIRLGLSFKNHLTSLVDYAHRSLSLRDIQSDVLLHDSSSESFDCEKLDDNGASCHERRPQLRHRFQISYDRLKAHSRAALDPRGAKLCG